MQNHQLHSQLTPVFLPFKGGQRRGCSFIRRSGFTLTELLVAVGLIVVLMLAVNAIFKSAADTVGIGQALSSSQRDQQSLQGVLKNDVSGLTDPASTAPFLMIRSSRVTAFTTDAQRLGDRDYNAGAVVATRLDQTLTYDRNGSGAETAPLSACLLDERSHRTDILAFFARGSFPRQTANSNTAAPQVAAPMSSQEAYLWYGHLALPDNAITPVFQDPGVGTLTSNPNNFRADQWTLGRMAMLMVQPDSTNYYIQDSTSTNQTYFARPASPPATSLEPLAAGSGTTVGGSSYTVAYTDLIQSSRYDLLGTSMANYRIALANVITAAPLPMWWNDSAFGYRFQAVPFPAKPLNQAAFAKFVPILLSNCSQFIVEFAGDFVAQDNNGNVTANGVPAVTVFNPSAGAITTLGTSCPAGTYTSVPIAGAAVDNEIDFTIVNGAKQIRWYGFPRNVYTDDDAAGAETIPSVGSSGTANAVQNMLDVVPLRDVMWSNASVRSAIAGGLLYMGAGFERPYDSTVATNGGFIFPSNTTSGAPSVSDYGSSGTSHLSTGNFFTSNSSAGCLNFAKYICCWSPDVPATTPRPKLIRILVKQDDSTGRLANTPYQQYVFSLP